ncbi:hypothetical protein AYI70_g3597 [Smittium culicis]|uniref:Uncharacterized protein n=1 Tax=Smittium culicis TaxID=133412 RepID=A0A1R1Y2V1_9FUNG|nr:hypothetical protein AYI70_g3597 [Smittium culicis]
MGLWNYFPLVASVEAAQTVSLFGDVEDYSTNHSGALLYKKTFLVPLVILAARFRFSKWDPKPLLDNFSDPIPV